MKTFIMYIITAIVVLAGSFFLWKYQQYELSLQKENNMTPISVVLDRTPNTNLTGIYVALQKGWYKDAGLDVTILPYSSTVNPDLLVAADKADVGVSATEGVLADAATGNPVVSIAAIIQHNTSGFLTLAGNDITRPRDFEGKIYGGRGSLSESAVVSAIIKKDGGQGNFKNVALDVEAMQALESKKVDFVRVFEGWEVIQARRQGYKVKYFPSLSYGIPDYYTPVLITSPKEIKEKTSDLKRFMTATAKGYEFARRYPKEAAQILIDNAPEGTFPNAELVYASQEFLSSRYADPSRKWGWQDAVPWHEYPQFLINSKAILDGSGKPVNNLNFDSLYTNEFLK